MGCGKSAQSVKDGKQLVPGIIRQEDHRSSSGIGIYALPNNRPLRNEDSSESYQDRSKNPALRPVYIYGYMCRSTANNLFYLDDEETIVYPCGAVAVLLNISSNTQRYLGGGEIKSINGHSREVTALAITPSRDLIATGEAGPNPLLCVWRPKDSLLPVGKLELGSKSQGISLLAFSTNGRFVSVVDHNTDQTVYVYEWKHRTCVFRGSASPGIVLNMTWCPGTTVFCTVGDESVYFWSAHGNHYEFQRERGKFDSEANTNFMTVVQWFNTGSAVTGDLKGRLHLWTSHKEPAKSYQVLPPNTHIRALSIINDQVVISGEDCKVQVLNATFKYVRHFETPSPAVSVDMYREAIVCGGSDGAVLEFGRNGRILVMDSHSFGELHGISLEPISCETLLSTGEDNRIKAWNVVQRRPLSSGILEVSIEDEAVAGSRAVDISIAGIIAVGHNDGHVTIRRSIPLINHITICLRGSSSSVTELRFSHNGNMLAVGSSDGKVHIYDVLSSYSLFFILDTGPKAIAAVEWNNQGTRLKTIDCDRGERGWDVETGMEIDWDQERMMQDAFLAFSSSLPSVSGASILTSTKAHHGNQHIQGTSWGLVEFHQSSTILTPSAYRLHAADVTNSIWSRSDETVFTCSAHDLVIVQWSVSENQKRQDGEHI